MPNLTFHVSDEELVVLNAFFLALSLPPVMAKKSKSSEQGLEDTLKQATLSLRKKGLIVIGDSHKQGEWVSPDLAQMLRDIAYGNQMTHLYFQRKGEKARQVAFYQNEGRFVQQELFEDAQHTISPAGDMGRNLVGTILQQASEGSPGEKATFPLDAWNLLLTSRAAGIADEVLAAFAPAAGRTEDENAGARLSFARDVLAAPVILELTGVYNRLQGKKEKASFVLADDSNWLVMESLPLSGQASLWALEVPRRSLMQAVEGVYASFGSSSDVKGRLA